MKTVKLKNSEIAHIHNSLIHMSKTLLSNEELKFEYNKISKFVNQVDSFTALNKEIESRKNNEFLSRSETAQERLNTLLRITEFNSLEKEDEFKRDFIKTIKEKYNVDEISNVTLLKEDLKEEFKEAIKDIDEEEVEVTIQSIDSTFFDSLKVSFQEYLAIRPIQALFTF